MQLEVEDLSLLVLDLTSVGKPIERLSDSITFEGISEPRNVVGSGNSDVFSTLGKASGEGFLRAYSAS
jgi:hypothetical protein